MRTVLTCLFGLGYLYSFGQLPMPCTFYTNQTASDLESFDGSKETKCLTIDFWEDEYLLNDDNFRLYSTENAVVSPNFSFDSANEGEFHITSAHIVSNLEAAWLYPTENYIVPMYTKTEWGVAFPENVQDAIDNWIINSNTGLSLTPALNPYNPDDIDIWAEVTHNGMTERINGFFYIPYERGDDPSIDPDMWDWIPQITEYNFRFRFSPIDISVHAVKIRATVAGFGEFEFANFEFKSAWNNVKNGFIKVSPNQHYLAYADNSLFFPVGMNLTPGAYDCHCDNGEDSDNCEECYQAGTNDPCCGLDFPYRQSGYNGDGFFQLGTEVKELSLPLASYKKLELVMEDYIASGANAIKFYLNPVHCDIEYERINNYYDRMHQAWELDNFVEILENNDIKMQFNMCFQSTLLFNAWGASNWDWSNTSNYQGDPIDPNNRGNCYWHDLGLDPLNPYEFFTNTEAITQYKKKLRYIIARWGYTPNVYLWEIFSEINGVGSGHTFPYEDNPTEGVQGVFDGADIKGDGIELPKPYDTDYTVKRQIISNWTNEIFSYLTYDLGVRQLMTCSYAGLAPLTLGETNSLEMSDALAALDSRDQTWENPLCDVVCWSDYNNTNKRMESRAREQVKRKNIFNNVTNFQDLPKPLLLGESGMGDPVMGLDYTGYITDLLSYPFSGRASAGMSWDEQTSTEYWPWMGLVRSFLDDHFFNTTNIGNETWLPIQQYFDVEGNDHTNSKAEVVYLVNGNEKTKLIGIVLNRTWSWWNHNTTPISQEFLNEVGPGCCLEWDFSNISSDSYNLKITDLGFSKRYKIMYFDPRDNSLIDTKWDYSGLNGNLNLQGFPTLNDSRPWFYIKIYHDPYIGPNTPFMPEEEVSVQYNEELFLKKENLENVDFISIYPNPSNGAARITCSELMTSIKITNSLGQIVFSSSLESFDFDVNLNFLETGLYNVSINEGTSRTTLVVAH